MRVQSREIFAALGVTMFSAGALAQSRCDCTSIVGTCQAQASVQSSFIELTSNSPQCSRVDYVVDGAPFVALVVDGALRQNRNPGAASPSVVVQSCRICVDSSVASEPEASSQSGLVADGEVSRLIGVAPAYPAGALARGTEGFVELRVTVGTAGTVTDAEVVSASPEGVFDDAALAAVSRWRYTQPSEPQTRTERIDFTLDDALFRLGAGRPVGSQPVAAAETRRNRCIQEDTRYDFGAVVDVGLMNACSEPLLVYSCAAGTGRDRDLWVCRDPERNNAAETLSDVGRLEITRAPNGEYWWLACTVDDASCRSDGREWVRSTDRQSARIDPQDRTRARLARSF